MRNLNLSRLARASESSFFKKEQAQQALDIRSKLTDAERAALKVKPLPSSSSSPSAIVTESHSPDVLPEISAHSVYSRAIQQAANDMKAQPQRMTLRPLLPRVTAITVIENKREPKIMRALGTGKLSLYNQQQQLPTSRPLPGGSQFADGAFMGMASLSIASAVVASVGLFGAVILWNKPGIVESWKYRSIEFRQKLDRQLGPFIRTNITARMSSGRAVSDETRHKATQFARAAVGLQANGKPTNVSKEEV